MLSLPFPSHSSLPFSQIIRAVKVRFTASLDTWDGGKTGGDVKDTCKNRERGGTSVS